MPRTFYTIDDLYAFCKENKFEHFSSKEHNDKPLIVKYKGNILFPILLLPKRIWKSV